MVTQPLQTRLKLLFTNNSINVTDDLMPDLLDFSYDDKETNEADEVSITLKDETGKWANTWKPDGGEVVRAYIMPGTVGGARGQLYCGKFYVDTLGVSGSPRIFTMRAVSIPLNKPIRKKLKSKAWEKKTLKGIAEEIAKEAGVSLIFDSEENPSFDRQDQNRESDLKFLSRLCEEAGLSLKLTDDTIVIFDQSSYEKKAPIKTLELGVSDILSWDFEQAQSDTYKSCTVTYRDPKKKVKGSAASYNMDLQKVKTTKKNAAVLSYTYVDPAADENGQEYELKKRAKSLDDAKRLAKATLRGLNMRRVTGNMSVVGDISLVAGVVVECRGFGSFDGNFIIEQATHTVNTGGYVTNVALRRVNNAY
jgi:phage protein D